MNHRKGDGDKEPRFFIDPRWLRYSAALSGAVMTKVVLIFLGYLGGGWLDRKLGTPPIFMFMAIVGAVALGLWWVLYVAEKRK